MLKPLHEQVVLEVKEKENKTKSGIILTSKERDETTIATVVSVGFKKDDEPFCVAPGDQVVYKSYATTEFSWGEKKYLLIKESDILAIVEEE